MDPIATWQLIVEAINAGCADEAKAGLWDLIDWFERHGFEPNVCPFTLDGLRTMYDWCNAVLRDY